MIRPPRTDRPTFLARLRQSGLVADAKLASIAARLPETDRGRLVARALVELGLLTKFQAEQLLAGRTAGFFLGPYRILEQLGRGGTGRVFKAQHGKLGRIVALKVLSGKLLRSGRGHELFAREARAAAALDHPNVVAALGAGRVGDRCFLALEYVNGPNLDRFVRQKGPLPIDQACDFIRQAALGLQYAHDRGMVHRDVKPGNLLLQTGAGERCGTCGVVKVSDFGLARLGGAGGDALGTLIVKANTVLGTPDFLSPEQARCVHRADGRSDLYSLGCSFYYLLTGQMPYPGGTALEKLLRHSTEEPTPVEWHRTEVPAVVSAVVRKLMAKDPAERFQTPKELANALTPFACHRPAVWTAPAPPDPFVDLTPTPEALPRDTRGQLTTEMGEPTPVAAPRGRRARWWRRCWWW